MTYYGKPKKHIVRDKANKTETDTRLRALELGNYAGIYVADGSTAQSIPTGATYTKLTGFTTDGQEYGATADSANDKITLTVVGKYLVNGSFSMTAGTNNVVFKCSAFLDGVEQDHIHWLRKIATGTDAGNAGFTGVIDVSTVPVDLDARIRHDQPGNIDFTPIYMNLNCHRIGE